MLELIQAVRWRFNLSLVDTEFIRICSRACFYSPQPKCQFFAAAKLLARVIVDTMVVGFFAPHFLHVFMRLLTFGLCDRRLPASFRAAHLWLVFCTRFLCVNTQFKWLNGQYGLAIANIDHRNTARKIGYRNCLNELADTTECGEERSENPLPHH